MSEIKSQVAFTTPKQTRKVLLTGAAGQIGYSLIPLVASGAVCGSETAIDLVLFDLDFALPALKGVVLEIEDGAYPLLRSVKATSDITEAFTGVQVALMVGGFPRMKGMDRKDLLAKNAQIFVAAGKALNDVGDKDCKVLVVANPANTNAFIMKDNCPNVPAENFTCLTRLDHNRAVYQIAAKLGVSSNDVGRIIIWGNHSNTMVPDASHAVVRKADGKVLDVPSALSAVDADADTWVKKVFTPTVQNRGAAVIEARQKSSAMSAANGVADHVRNWLSTVPSERARAGDYVSLGLVSKGWYGITPGIVFSFPCEITPSGEVKVVEGLPITPEVQALIKATEAELIAERDIYLTIKAETATA